MTSANVLRASLAIVVLVMLAPHVAATLVPPSDDGGGGTIGVTITDPTGTATPTPTPTPTSPGSAASGGSSGGGSHSGGGAAPEPTPSSPTTADAATGEHGTIVSGILARTVRELNPFGGAVYATVSVTNHTDAPVRGDISFRLSTPFGTQIGPTIQHDIGKVLPGRTRLATVRLAGVAQWPLVFVTATFRAYPVSAGSPSIERDAWIFPIPWLLAVLIVLSIAVLVILRLARPDWFRASAVEAQ